MVKANSFILSFFNKNIFKYTVAKVETKSSLLVFWDLGGQVSLRGIWEKYYDQCHALIFVIDSNDQIHLEEAKQTFGFFENNEIILN